MIAITNFSESHMQQQQLLQICTHLQIEFCNLWLLCDIVLKKNLSYKKLASCMPMYLYLMQIEAAHYYF